MPGYFDIKYLRDYLELGLQFKVFVQGRYLVVLDPYDLVTSQKGYGYESSGKRVNFEFMDIDHVKIGSVILTREDLEKLQNPEKEEKPEQEAEPEQEVPNPEEGAEDEDVNKIS